SITYQYNTTNIYKTNFFEDFFSNIRLMDVNAKGALLFKIAVYIVVIHSIVYIGFRMFGYNYASFIVRETSMAGNMLWGWIVFAWPMSFVLPLLIKHWSIYAILLVTFHSMVSLAATALNIGVDNIGANQIDSQIAWLMKGAVALVLTLGYAWIVKTYLRNPPKTITKIA
ncbi:MAG: hypothetical protein FWE18_05915, partial [Alphaproteobacteria bacterium]|nr:hypothetical protein [Alphaproteobacteria bacterium]